MSRMENSSIIYLDGGSFFHYILPISSDILTGFIVMNTLEHAIITRLTYCMKTGIFTWVDGRNAGKRAGGKNSRGYRHILINGTWVKEHRAAFLKVLGKWPDDVVDHINRKTWDNRWSNLRDVSQLENMQNTGLSTRLGVHQKKSTGRWEAKAQVRGTREFIGYFDSKAEAISARREFLSRATA